MGLALFDFDGTLTTRDTILPLGFAIARAGPSYFPKISRLVVSLGLLKGRVISNHRFKELFCLNLLKGMTNDRVSALAREFFDAHLENIVNRRVHKALVDHQRSGDDVYLISSNFAVLLGPLQETWAPCGLIATNTEVDEGRFTGRISGRACDGSEKLGRVVAQFGERAVKDATAYGNGTGDRQLLAYVKKAVWV